MPLTESQKRYYDRLARERRANAPTIRQHHGINSTSTPRQSTGMHIVRSINRGANKIYSLLPKQVGQVFAMSPMGMLYNGARKAINDFVSPEAAEVADAAMNVYGITKGVKSIKPKKVINYINRGFTREKDVLPITGRYNTLRRYVGTGKSGYHDAFDSGIIRGNMTPPEFSAANLAHMRKRFGDKMSASDFRDMASNNITTKEQFNRINNILHEGSQSHQVGRFNLGKKYSLGDSFEEYVTKKQQAYQASRVRNMLQHMNNRHPETNGWLPNWGEHSLATFAKEGEALSNNLQFPGDYAVEIMNGDRYARTATSMGHFAEHPTTYKPMEWNHPDVNWYHKSRTLTGKTFMKRVPRDKVVADYIKRTQGINLTQF